LEDYAKDNPDHYSFAVYLTDLALKKKERIGVSFVSPMSDNIPKTKPYY